MERAPRPFGGGAAEQVLFANARIIDRIQTFAVRYRHKPPAGSVEK